MLSKNINLHNARRKEEDEFYTQLSDIGKELKHYKSHFKDKVIYCNCDDYRYSNFYKHFVNNFESLGLKKLIASHYKERQLDLFNDNDFENPKVSIYEGRNKNEIITLRGDGDFRSQESIEFLKQSDIVITNPPFSLFREYINQLVKYDKKFLIIGNMNAVTLKEFFPLIKENKVWLGISPRGMDFITQKNELESVNAVWFTNLDNHKRHKDLILHKKYNPKEYPNYDNYNAINVDKTLDIPKDYDGIMGVPITFLDKYNPKQFEIISFRKGDDGEDLIINGKYPYNRILIRKRKRGK